MTARLWHLGMIAMFIGGCLTHDERQAGDNASAQGLPGAAAPSACPPAGTDRAMLRALGDDEFRVSNDERRNELALALLDCLDHPDPFLRDDIAYTGLAAMMRRSEITPATAREMLGRLSASLARDDDGGDGFRRPFAAIVLAEVARMDRVAPYLTTGERARLVSTAREYLSSVSDYRGFTDAEGWRHGVAHGADLVLQLVLNENVGAEGVQSLMVAVFSQVAPASGHSYIFGEPQRLARPVLFAATRGLIADTAWPALFDKLVNPAPFDDWGAVFRSQEGLSRLHNTRAFAYALEVRLKRNPQMDFGGLPGQVDRLIKALP